MTNGLVLFGANNRNYLSMIDSLLEWNPQSN